MIPHHPPRIPEAEALARAAQLFAELDARRSVRDFSADPVPRTLIELAIRTASTAPSGAHKQPWTFVAISDPAVKARIREAAEAEEQRFYAERAPDTWLDDLAPLGTTWRKPFLETAPWLVVVFGQAWGRTEDGSRSKHYYVAESVGIAAGLFITALHHAGLATLTHTPSPMRFLTQILDRPDNERPYILFPVGWPAAACEVPDLTRKPLDEVAVFVEG
ncbi:MAG: iodotyrosine deiodinase [Myxococcota bacterium]|jgi:iodotyrosine deiodinase